MHTNRIDYKNKSGVVYQRINQLNPSPQSDPSSLDHTEGPRPNRRRVGNKSDKTQGGTEIRAYGKRRAMLTCIAPRRRGRWRCGCRSRGWRRGASATTCRRTWGRSRRGAGRARSSARASSARRSTSSSSSSSSSPAPPLPPPAAAARR